MRRTMWIIPIILLLITGTRTAPRPLPSITKSGGELYSLPELKTITSLIFPLTITGDNWASSPRDKVTRGSLI